MRYIVLSILAMLVTNVMAANPSYVCKPESGCKEERTATHDIGRGATITLPEGWTYFSYPQAPIPEMAGLREIRAFKGVTVVAITPMPNIDRRSISEDWVREIQTKGAAQYIADSKEKAVNFVSMSREDLVGGYVSFTAGKEGEKPFRALPNRTFASLTSFVIAYKFIIFSVTVASELGSDSDYVAAIDAIRKIK